MMNAFVYSFATIAASVGYVYTRKTISNSRIPKQANEDLESALLEKEIAASSVLQGKLADVDSNAVVEMQTESQTEITAQPAQPEPEHTPTSRRASLKRKSIDDHYPVGDESSAHRTDITLIPCKRTRTPTNDTDGEGDAKFAEYVLVQLSKGDKPEIELIDLVAHEETESGPQATVDSDASEGSDEESTFPQARAGSQPPLEFAVEPPRSPSPALSQSAPEDQTKAPVPVLKPAPRGFAAFAGSTSPFKTSTFGGGASGAFGSGFTDSGFGGLGSTSGQSAWRAAGDMEEGQVNDLRLAHPVLAFGSNESKSTGSASKLATASHVPKAQPDENKVTGEEDEDVKLEIKGVRLYIKRGQKDFVSAGTGGTLRLLAEKSGSSERLLFRRDPLWQVSMNVCINAGVRCSFDKEEKVLRITLKEMNSQTNAQEVVVYAFKPGKSTSKQDFVEFGESLLENPKLTRS